MTTALKTVFIGLSLENFCLEGRGRGKLTLVGGGVFLGGWWLGGV